MSAGECMALATLAIPSIIGLGWVFFRNFESFWDAFCDFLEALWLRYTWSHDWAAIFKFCFFLLSCVFAIAGERALIERIWGVVN